MKLAWEGCSGDTINEARIMGMRMMGKDLELQERDDAQRKCKEGGRKKGRASQDQDELAVTLASK